MSMQYESAGYRIGELIYASLRGKLNSREREELEAWLNEDPDNREFFEREMTTQSLGQDLRVLREKNDQECLQEIYERLGFVYHAQKNRIPSWGYFRYGAAAAVLLAMILSANFWYRSIHRKDSHAKLSNVATRQVDIAAGGNKAVLILSDGKRIVLDSAGNGQLAKQGVATVSKMDSGSLIYQVGALPVDAPIVFNTLATPRSGQFHVTLPDGTQVWLNNASRLHYPTAFSSNKREVDLEGEAYFEVAKNDGSPFAVHTRNQTIEVLGTGFNVTAYEDEELTKTTLLEGKVRVQSGSKHPQVLAPGQQASSNSVGNLTIERNVDVYAVTSWKDGRFNFDNSDVTSVMRQLARWYDVEVIFNSEFPLDRTFDGNMGRSLSLLQVLHLLEGNRIFTRLEGRKLFVSPEPFTK